MIRYKLSDLLIDKGISQNWICKQTKIRPGTIGNYFHGTVKEIRPEHLEKLCKVLDCKISDIIEYVPDKK